MPRPGVPSNKPVAVTHCLSVRGSLITSDLHGKRSPPDGLAGFGTHSIDQRAAAPAANCAGLHLQRCSLSLRLVIYRKVAVLIARLLRLVRAD